MFCPNCGKQLPDGAKFCTACGKPLTQPAPAQQKPPVQQPAPVLAQPPVKGKRENVFLGIVGALIGAILALYMIIIPCELIGLWGIFAGLFAAASIFFGYQALGRKLGNAGIVICVILLCGVVWFGNLVTWGNAVSEVVTGYYAAKLGRSVEGLREQFALLPGLYKSYCITLALRLGAAILGAVLITIYAVRARSKPEEYQPRGGRLFLGVTAVAILMTVIFAAMGGEPEQVDQKKSHAVVEMRKYLEEENQRLTEEYSWLD